MHTLLHVGTLVTVDLVRSGNRVRCHVCTQRRVCYRLIASHSPFTSDWTCASCSGITQSRGGPTAIPASADEAPSVWDGVYESPLLREARASVALDHDEREGTQSDLTTEAQP